MRCRRCASAERNIGRVIRGHEIDNKILEMREAGMLNTDIATCLKMTRQAVNSRIFRMRSRGVVVPKSTYDPHPWVWRVSA